MFHSSGSIRRVLAGAFMMSLGVAGAARAQTPPSPAAIAAALQSGAARLGPPLQHADGGWWALAADASDAACLGGAGSTTVSCVNLFGINGLGLLEAYRHNPSSGAALAGAVLAGDALVARFALLSATLNATDPHLRPFTQDVEFLGALAQTTGNSIYMTTATDWFAVVVSQYPSAALRVDDMFANRGSQGFRTFAVWDAASLVRAARGVGNVDYATAAANRIVEREADWKFTSPIGVPADNPYGYDFTFLAEGSLLLTIVDLPGFTAKRDEYRDYLIGSQDADGAWDVGDAQMTAYIVKGLIALGDPAAATAIARAENYFIAGQQPAGGWLWYGTEYTEVDSEVMQALAALYNTPAGSDVAAQPSPLAGVQFSTVSAAGTTTVAAIDPLTTGSVPGGYALATLAYEVATTAAFTGPITSCFWVPTITDPTAFANVRITHNEDGTLVDRTILSGAMAPNFATKTVCARTATLSPFAVALKIRKDKAPPVIDSVTPSASTLPATGAMVTITLAVVAHDAVDPAPVCAVTRVASNIKDVDHNGVPDWAITGPLTVSLEAATRKHKDRTYRITVKCTDASGNTSSEKTTVVVSRLP